MPPPAECRSCRAPLDRAEAVEPRWAQVADVEFLRTVTGWTLLGVPVSAGFVDKAAAR